MTATTRRYAFCAKADETGAGVQLGCGAAYGCRLLILGACASGSYLAPVVGCFSPVHLCHGGVHCATVNSINSLWWMRLALMGSSNILCWTNVAFQLGRGQSGFLEHNQYWIAEPFGKAPLPARWLPARDTAFNPPHPESSKPNNCPSRSLAHQCPVQLLKNLGRPILEYDLVIMKKTYTVPPYQVPPKFKEALRPPYLMLRDLVIIEHPRAYVIDKILMDQVNPPAKVFWIWNKYPVSHQCCCYCKPPASCLQSFAQDTCHRCPIPAMTHKPLFSRKQPSASYSG